jgi:MFS transporter, DHA2 family, multidrug resistance protein
MGNASGIFNLARNVGGGIGISLTTTWVARGTQTHQALMVGHLNPYSPEFQQRFQTIAGALGQYGDSATAQKQAYELLYGAVQQQANLFAYVDTFRLLAFLCILCIPFVFLLKRAKSSGGSVAMH